MSVPRLGTGWIWTAYSPCVAVSTQLWPHMLPLALFFSLSALLTAWDTALPHDVGLVRREDAHPDVPGGFHFLSSGGRTAAWSLSGVSEVFRPLPPHVDVSFEGWYHRVSHQGLYAPNALQDDSQSSHAQTEGDWESLAVIPGVVRRGVDPHAFLLLYLDGEWTYSRFPLDSFSCGPSGKVHKSLHHPSYSLTLGDNVFTDRGFTVDVPANNGGRAVRVDVVLEEQDTKGADNGNGTVCVWPVDVLAPGAMGWFAYVPTMELFHGIGRLDARVQRLVVETELVDGNPESVGDSDGAASEKAEKKGRSGGKIVRVAKTGPAPRFYAEKDWGSGGFPTDWVWIQSNTWEYTNWGAHKDASGCEASLMVSWAMVPIRFGGLTVARIPGFITGLLVRGRLYRFATYTGAKVARAKFSPAAEDGESASLELAVEDGHHRLEVACTAPGSSRTVLWGPRDDLTMERFVVEHLGGSCTVLLIGRQVAKAFRPARIGVPYWRSEGQSGNVIFKGVATGVGMEIMSSDPDAFARALMAMPSIREGLACAFALSAATAALYGPVKKKIRHRKRSPPIPKDSSSTMKALSRDLSTISLTDGDMMDYDDLPLVRKDKDA